MLSLMLGLSFSIHLMTYQDGESHLDQTLAMNGWQGRPFVIWSYHA